MSMKYSTAERISLQETFDEKRIIVSLKGLKENEEFIKLKTMQQLLYGLDDETYTQTLGYASENFMDTEENKANFVIDISNISNFQHKYMSIYSKLFATLDEKYHLLDILTQQLEDIKTYNNGLWLRFHLIDFKEYRYKIPLIPNELVPESKMGKIILFPKFRNQNKQTLQEQSSYIDVIRNDDIDRFTEMASFPSFNINMILLDYFLKGFSLIQIAAQHSATKCFRYLVNNGASLDGIMEHAIKGGCIEIMEIISQLGIKPCQDDVLTAIKCHRIDIFDWLVDGFGFEIPKESLIPHRFCHGFDYVDEMNLCEVIELSENARLSPVLDFFIKENRVKRFRQHVLDDICYKIFSSAIKDNLIDRMKRIADIFSYNLEIMINIAIVYENMEMIKYMLKFPGIDVNKQTIYVCYGLDSARTVVNVAIIRGNMEITQMIMSHPSFDPNGHGESDVPLHVAIKKGYIDAVKMLLSFSGIDVNKISWILPLTCAIKYRNNEIIDLLINHPDIEVNDDEKCPPLCMACETGNIEVIKRLLSFPKIKVNGNASSCPLEVACRKNRIDIVKMLLNHPDIDVSRMAEKIPQLMTAIDCQNPEIIQTLLNHLEIDTNKKDICSSSPNKLAQNKNDMEFVNLQND